MGPVALFFFVAIAVFAWGHFALERNVNRMAQQLQDQLDGALARVAQLEDEIHDLKRHR